MDAAGFKKLISKHFSPRIRELGWKGSGFHFRKIEDNHIVKIFGLQGNWYGGSVYCETAIHFDFIPDLAGRPINKTTYASCVIRERMSPKGDGDYYWNFKDKVEENIESINQIWTTFENHGQKFYKDFANFPEPFTSITPADFNSNMSLSILDKYFIQNKIHLVWLLKEINQFIGKMDLATDFAEVGMKMVYNRSNIMAKRNNGIVDQSYVRMNKKLFSIK
tara:strand:+ start:1183 stop:1845 length:663 start_codon:yes stop_codon:yes gene_type:complete